MIMSIPFYVVTIVTDKLRVISLMIYIIGLIASIAISQIGAMHGEKRK